MIGMTVKLESLDWKEWLFFGGGRNRCPSSKKLLKAVREGESKKVNRWTLDHVSRCESCSRDFRFIFGVLNEEEKLKIELETLVSERKKSSLRVEKSAPSSFLSSCFRFAAYSFSVLLLMFSDPLFHFSVEGLGSCHKKPLSFSLLRQILAKIALAASGATGYKNNHVTISLNCFIRISF